MNDIDYVSLAKNLVQDMFSSTKISEELSELINEMSLNNNFDNEIFYVESGPLRALYICNERCSNEPYGVSFYGKDSYTYICFVSRAELAREIKLPINKLPNNFLSSILEVINFL